MNTYSTVINGAEPAVLLTDDMPGLSCKITRYRCLVAISSQPGTAWNDGIGTAYGCQHADMNILNAQLTTNFKLIYLIYKLALIRNSETVD